MYCTPVPPRLPVIAALVGLLTTGPTLLRAETFPYTVEDLGALPGETHAIPFGINARGQVVGWSGVYPNRAFVFTDGVGMVELPGPGGRTFAIGRGINDAGVVVGESWGNGMPCVAVRWTAGLGEELGALDTSSRAWAISSGGIVVGDTPVDALGTDAFIYTDADGAALLVPTRDTSNGYDINPAGHVTGAMVVGNAYHAYRIAPETGIQDLGTVPGFAFSFGKAINISGQVAGTIGTATGNSQHVFRFTDGIGMVDLGGVGETNDVWGMNARGDFVGRGLPTSGLERAFLYTDEGGLQDFSLLIDPALGLRMFYAHDINDAGQIVGLAYEYNVGRWLGVRLTPTTPAGPLAAVAMTPAKLAAGGSCVGWVTITEAAPSGGAMVTLSSESPLIVSVPGSVAIAAGERHGSFTAVVNPVTEATPVQVTADYDGQTRSTSVEVIPSAATGIGDGHVPVLRVRALAPNPTGRFARIEYELSQPSDVRITVYDVTGGLVRTLVDSPQAAGLHPTVWDGRDHNGSDVASGAYFVRIQAGVFRHTEKLMIVR